MCVCVCVCACVCVSHYSIAEAGCLREVQRCLLCMDTRALWDRHLSPSLCMCACVHVCVSLCAQGPLDSATIGLAVRVHVCVCVFVPGVNIALLCTFAHVYVAYGMGSRTPRSCSIQTGDSPVSGS